ncbi:MAG: CDP-diacylglycerol--glycerol-3-phosphate 3-phosphatidyltransferase [Deltaproteobacteria bacterium HGW-Deltaproteobacteria-19]|nr:MAG: CDP-diacylglycerol--glycerol-3-phosphate 3-phosphatidyltransferase [Deltaproteobacteria bacterium HGW-Deltaproteobacteria-19]
MNIPNSLTLLRIILVPAIVILLMQGSFKVAILVFLISGLTDVLDGYLARVLHQQTVLGSYLDPIADKALMISCYVTLAVKKILPGWLSVVVISRDCIILIGVAVLTIMSVSHKIQPAPIGKLTTAVQILTVFVFLVSRAVPGAIAESFMEGLVWVTAFFTVVSGFYYIMIGVQHINQQQKPRSV